MVQRNAAKPVDGTRERVLDAALDLFGERGLAGTTVRDIAVRAGVNIAAVSYHFGGKEELYRTVAASIVEGVERQIRERSPGKSETLDSPAAALSALEALFEALVDVVVGPQEMRRAARFLIREHMQPTAAFEVIFGTMSGVHRRACLLFGQAAGLAAESPSVRLRVFLIIGQAIFLRIAEQAVLRRMEMESYGPEFLARVKAMLRQNVRLAVQAAREEPS